MGLFFWQRERRSELDGAVSRIVDQLKELRDDVAGIAAGILEQREEVAGQLAKLARLQYKTGQDMQTKLEQLTQGLAEVRQWQAEYGAKSEELNSLLRQREYLLNMLLCQLDEMDGACAGLKGEEDHAWQLLLQQWRQRIITALAELGICEVEVLGKTFEPQVAECVGVVPKTPATAVPYEVAEVVKRGFANSEGIILRKAQVITYGEASRHD